MNLSRLIGIARGFVGVGGGLFVALLGAVVICLGLRATASFVYPCVPTHIALDAETSATTFVGACEGFLSGVCVSVYLEAAGSGEPLSAVVAFISGGRRPPGGGVTR